MPAVIPGLYRLHGDITQVKYQMFPVLDRFFPGDDPAIWIPVFDTVYTVVVVMGMGYENQIGRQIIPLTHIRIDVDHLALVGHNANTGLPLVEQFCRTGNSLRRFILLCLNRLHLGRKLYFSGRWSLRETAGGEQHKRNQQERQHHHSFLLHKI